MEEDRCRAVHSRSTKILEQCCSDNSFQSLQPLKTTSGDSIKVVPLSQSCAVAPLRHAKLSFFTDFRAVKFSVISGHVTVVKATLSEPIFKCGV